MKEADIDFVKTIISVSQLKQDYTTHDLKKKLCNTYDVFLVESEIAEHVYTLLGKAFISKRKRPIQIDTKKTKLLKITIENAIKKVSFNLSAKSNISCFEIGIIKMDNIKIADNVMTSIDQLKEKWPGSWKNINRLYMKPMRPSKISIPIYYSSTNPNDVSIPKIKSIKQNRLDKLAEQLKKKSKKLKLDIKLKKVVKQPAEKKTPAAKNDKAAVVPKVEIKEEGTVVKKEVVKTEKKKKRKNDEVAVVAVAEEIQTETTEPAKKKKKKKNVNLKSNDASETVAVVVVKPELETQKKNKNKKKAKSVVTDTIIDDTAAQAEKEPISTKKNTKKAKKNKA